MSATPQASSLDRAQILLAQGKEEAALGELRSLLQHDPDNLFALGNAGLILARRGEFARASQYLARAHRLAPSDIQLGLALLEVYARSRRKQEAEQVAADLRLNSRLQSPQIFGAAGLLMQIGSYDAAAGMLKSDSSESLQHHDLLGAIYAEMGDVRMASDEWQEAIRLAPDDPERYFRLGMLYLRYRTPALAVLVFSHGVERIPASPLLWMALGISQCLDEKLEQAEQSLHKAIALNPRFQDAYLVLGDVLEQEKPREALELFRRTMASNPKLPVAYYYYGRLALQMNEASIEETTHVLRKAVALDPGFADGHYELARALEEGGNVSEAIAQLEESLRLDPKLFKAQYRLAILYKKGGQLEKSAAAMKAFQLSQKSHDSQTEMKQLDYEIREP
jgi:tetratricopeptide (TPR) repeat protein